MKPTVTPSPRAQELYSSREDGIARSTDRLLSMVMVVQWPVGIILALLISPHTWIGATSHVHQHVWAAVLLGAALSGFPLWLARNYPGHTITRHSMAVAQVLWSALLIHVTGGRIETHFHVFGSLVILSLYRDWKVLITATIVVAADHFVRGFWWPQSVFGVFLDSPYRWLEHSAWVPPHLADSTSRRRPVPDAGQVGRQGT